MLKIQIDVSLASLPRKNLLMVPSVSVHGMVCAAHWELLLNDLPGAGQVWFAKGRELCQLRYGWVPLHFPSIMFARFGNSLGGICQHGWVSPRTEALHRSCSSHAVVVPGVRPEPCRTARHGVLSATLG